MDCSPEASACRDARTFPEGFVWGCGTSPTQVEGDTVNEWRNFKARDGSTPDDGPQHLRRYRYDFQCIADLKLNAYRLGFDWARLQREPGGEFDRVAALRYLEMLAELRSLGVEPFLTLFHFNCPPWLAERGGWLCPEAPELFADFARRLADLVDDEVEYWITVNEPAVYCVMAYLLGEFPPHGRLRIRQAFRALHQMQRGHALAEAAIKSRLPGAKVGITKHFKRFMPCRRWHPVDHLMTALAERLFDRAGLKGFIRHGGRTVSDFIGVNYYGRMRMKGFNGISPITGFSREQLEAMELECDEMWEQDPEWLRDCLGGLWERYGLPLFVTENGVATRDEAARRSYLLRHLSACRQAIAEGVGVKGFFYWSLLDNFEFGEGLTKPFGLLSVDFADERRRRELRPAARLYREIAAANALPAPREPARPAAEARRPDAVPV